MLKKALTFIFTVVAAIGLQHAAPALAATQAEQNLSQIERYVDEAVTDARAGHLQDAHTAFGQFHDAWFNIEDGVKQQSGQAYTEIESNMGQVEYAFTQNNSANVIQALQRLQTVNHQFIDGHYSATGFQKQDLSLDDFLLMLQRAKSDAAAGNIAQASADMTQIRESWLSVEGSVIAQSQTAYDDTERDMVTASAQLTGNPPNADGAVQTLNKMIATLSPLAGKSGYSMWDAAMIPIREGLEALLVVAALLAFTKKSESKRGKGWVLAGVTVGLMVSLVLAIVVKYVFTSGAFGKNNFLISGWTGVLAAVMLLYMSYWLHSKSQISDWNQFLRTKTQAALSTGRLLSLGTLAFLAVFREGTETVLFIIGMVNQISLQNLVLGLLIGAAILAAVAFIMMGIGLRLPIRAFFLISSIIVFYLCLKFTGMGIHSLQLAGLIPSASAPGIPAWSAVALYPSWQSAVPQLLLVVAALAVLVWRRLARHKQAVVARNG